MDELKEIELKYISIDGVNAKFAPRIILRYITGPDGKIRDQFLWDRKKDFITLVLLIQRNGVDYLRLKREFKFGVVDYVLTSAAGAIDKDDLSPKHAAERELQEEFGVIALDVELVAGPLVESPDKIVNGRQWVFLGKGSIATTNESEPGQQIDFPLTKEGMTELFNHPENNVVLQRCALYEVLRHLGKLDLVG